MKTLLALSLLALLTFSKPATPIYTEKYVFFTGGVMILIDYAGERAFYLYSDNYNHPHFYADWRYDDLGREGLYIIAYDNQGNETSGIMSQDGALAMADGIRFVEGK